MIPPWTEGPGSRGEPPHPEDPTFRDPTPAELARRCPYCGELPLPTSSEWCSDFDRLIDDASGISQEEP